MQRAQWTLAPTPLQENALKSNIFITGFSGSGKTSVGRMVAHQLGWRFVDIDDEIVERAGRSIEAIFSEHGEAYFRGLERDCLAEVCKGDRQVVSTGGGVTTDAANRQIMEWSGAIVCLEARPETVHRRLQHQQDELGGPTVRPMLTASDPLARIRFLKGERQPTYTLAHWTIHTDHLEPSEVVSEVLRAWQMLKNRAAETQSEDSDTAAVVRASSGSYPIWVGWGLLDQLGERVKRVLQPSAAYIITDEGVYRPAMRAHIAMEAAGVATDMFVIPPGERSKTLETAQHIYTWLAERKAERGHLILAVGGGVVGDLAGFVAATYLRGMPFAQVPTSLLAMMDAAIGGKVAVDLDQGKNLVGAFYQPEFVLADVQVLETLPQRELASGWAEAIKHGLILDSGLLATFELQHGPVQALEREAATDVIRRSVAIKAQIISRDEKETLGVRVLLNYGHTIGHAIEAATGYNTFLHGEAVSIGMMGAAYISHAMGLMSEEEVERQRAVLERFGLPLSCRGADISAILDAMRSDKKTAGKAIRWVLLDGIGNAVTRNDVPDKIVREVLDKLAN